MVRRAVIEIELGEVEEKRGMRGEMLAWAGFCEDAVMWVLGWMISISILLIKDNGNCAFVYMQWSCYILHEQDRDVFVLVSSLLLELS